MKFIDLIPAEVQNKLIQTIKIWFRTSDQNKQITNVLLPYKTQIEKHMPLQECVLAIEKAVAENNGKKNRVLVHDGSGQKVLGYGQYIGETKVWFFQMPDGSLRSSPNAESKPTDIPPGATLHQSDNNPKIILDDGRMVYGCQVWWEFATNEDTLHMHQEVKMNYQWN